MMVSEIEALALLLVLAFVGGYALRIIRAWGGRLRARRKERLREVRAKRAIWPRWV